MRIGQVIRLRNYIDFFLNILYVGGLKNLLAEKFV